MERQKKNLQNTFHPKTQGAKSSVSATKTFKVAQGHERQNEYHQSRTGPYTRDIRAHTVSYATKTSENALNGTTYTEHHTI